MEVRLFFFFAVNLCCFSILIYFLAMPQGLWGLFPLRACVLSHFSCVQFFPAPWTVAHQAPMSMGFSRQEYWSGFPCPPPGDLPDPGMEPASLTALALAGEFFTTSGGEEWQ